METKPRKARGSYGSKYIVHDGRKFVYFVIQKVACSSVKTALLPLFGFDGARVETTHESGTQAMPIHKLFDRSRCQVDKERLLQGMDLEYREYFKFAFVRNPWDRLVSCYSQKVAGGPRVAWLERVNRNLPEQRGRFYREMPFAEFVEAVSAIPDEEADPHFCSQYPTVCDPEGRIMADFVGRFENLKEDFAAVSQKIIGAPTLELPHRLQSWSRESRPYTDFYDERLRDLVLERYSRDVELFGYSY